VPPVPPRVIEPLPSTEPATLEPVPELPAGPSPAPTRPRPQPPRDSAKTEQPKTEPKPENPPETTTPAHPTQPVPPLRPFGSVEGPEAERQVRDVIDRTYRILNNIDYQLLSDERKVNYDSAKNFLKLAEEQLKSSNFMNAKSQADRAETIAKRLTGR
jgi:hypothetical protein